MVFDKERKIVKRGIDKIPPMWNRLIKVIGRYFEWLYKDWCDGKMYAMKYNHKTGEREKLDDDLINYDDIHCLYSPDRSCFIGDGYPNTGSSRYIMLYDFESKKSRAIVKIYSHPVDNTDIRCDLHNRFNQNGTIVSFDSYHSERREIMIFEFDREKLLK